MISEWNQFVLGEIAELVIDYRGKTPKKLGGDWCECGYRVLSAKNIKTGRIVQPDTIRYIDEDLYRKWMKDEVQRGDILITSEAPFGQIFFWGSDEKIVLGQRLFCVRIKPEYDARFIYYYMTTPKFQNELDGRATGTTVMGLRQPELMKCVVCCPDIQEQKVIATILSSIDAKIIANEKVNDNLEQQISSIFANLYAEKIELASVETCPQLGDLVSIVDNRGKTPPLTMETLDYPIIDVGALKGDGRIVDFNNCTKYVDVDTYNTWFRSGHPKSWDILLSTVGSLAEIKIYLGSKGCIAQNVVALRAMSISPLYLYQYLKYIRSDLVAYNIGSVQPSIKVTHINKHPIYIPETTSLQNFEETAKSITEQIYANCNENETLKSIRDTLLPKLMSGEIDVSAVRL